MRKCIVGKMKNNVKIVIKDGGRNMAFQKEYRSIMEEFPEWEYLTEIGVKDMFGKTIEKYTTDLIIDRERNYFLIPQGLTNINRDVREIHFYALCIDGAVLNMEVNETTKGKARDYTFECHWNIEKIIFPEGWIEKGINNKELINIIKEAFTVQTYTKTFTPERTKSLTIEVSALDDKTIEKKFSK